MVNTFGEDCVEYLHREIDHIVCPKTGLLQKHWPELDVEERIELLTTIFKHT